MKLAHTDIREIVRLLEAGQPLPEKYRFQLFDDKREVELVWNGKTGEVCQVVLPFQVIEQVDEPRAEKDVKLSPGLFDQQTGRQLSGWSNKLIWGDNRLILSSLKNGPLRAAIEAEGGLKLIYIDPPFDVGADFSMDVEIGEGAEHFTKQPSALEQMAYRDTWGKGADSFIAMIYERLVLMRDLLAEDGSIYVHCDWRVNAYIRLAMDEVFGHEDYFQNEISWMRLTAAKAQSNYYSNVKDSIFIYHKSNSAVFHSQHIPSEKDDKNYPHIEEKTDRRYGSFDFTQKGSGPLRKFGKKILTPPPGKHWIWTQEKIDEGMRQNRIIFTSNGTPRVKRYLDEKEGNYLGDLWIDELVKPLSANSTERTGYPTQKPEALLERIIKASSNENDLVADFFCGSGTMAAVAEKLGRKWICADLGKFAVHTTRKRMINVQRQLKQDDKPYRAFEIFNLGKYERQHYIGVNANLRTEDQQQQMIAKEKEYTQLILRAYRAEPTTGFNTFHGKKADRMVAIGPINLPVSRLFVEEVLKECDDKSLTKADILGFKFEKEYDNKSLTKADILGFDFEMGLFPQIQEEARSRGIDLAMKYIPRDVFDKRAVEKDEVIFHDVSFIEVKPIVKKGNVAVELTDFSVFYNQDSISHAERMLKNGKSKIVVERGQVIKISKDKKGIFKRDVLTQKWSDWIDYWSVDFDFESKKEIIQQLDPDSDKYEEVWTGDYVFENEWQSFRTKKNRALELTSIAHECPSGRRKIAVKVVDIFGNDTMKVIEVKI